MHGYRGSCACGKGLARADTGSCEMCTRIPRPLQWRDHRYQPLATRCSGCGIRLTVPCSRIRGYCEECALLVRIPDHDCAVNTTDPAVTGLQAIAVLQAEFPGTRITDTDHEGIVN